MPSYYLSVASFLMYSVLSPKGTARSKEAMMIRRAGFGFSRLLTFECLSQLIMIVARSLEVFALEQARADLIPVVVAGSVAVEHHVVVKLDFFSKLMRELRIALFGSDHETLPLDC